MTRYIVKMIWVCLFASLIAANVGATIITETRITTTKIAVSAHSHTRPLDLASSDSKILKVDAISVDVHTPETGADKRQISINTTTISTQPSNGPFSNGSTAHCIPQQSPWATARSRLEYTITACAPANRPRSPC
jgi:hypothetical protein